MLFGYPIAATLNNWLHDCMVEAIKNVHAAVDSAKRCPAWPKVFPRAYQATLKPRTGLRDRVKAYNRAIRGLTKADRDLVLAAVADQNRIADLLSGACNCTPIDGLHQDVREPVKNLFGFAFDLLTELKVRDQHYDAIYAAATEHMCPFCGTEYFEAPGTPREALDHYLAKSRYPFAAANLRNLVPMGHKCNSNYKLASDLLYGVGGSRRVAFDPYNHTTINVVLDDSDPFGGVTANTPKWTVKFAPDTPAVQTWDEVFSIRERYRQSHLDPDFARWLAGFQSWARSVSLQADTDDKLIDALRQYEEYWVASGIQDRAFLKAAVFRMLRRHCELGHQRLKDQLRDLVAPLVKTGGEVVA
ncbi:hypothetical protein NR800_19955 [Corallococcus interemptor]|uniref:hypothetical protein n=1 Tax=Corallococcus TaxID=83461 RepID=UPI001CBF4B5A|nr:hypothetical protein [Corallococcus sp. AS-1-12]MBZ4331417.1 hypothetical protein [Corallococcus sp. AS-1-12]